MNKVKCLGCKAVFLTSEIKLVPDESSRRFIECRCPECDCSWLEFLNEKTAKRSEICSKCGGINTLVDGSLCKKCQAELSECKSSEA